MPGTSPVRVRMEWCHNGIPKVKYFTRGELETEDVFNARVASEAKAALDEQKPTGDCSPAFP